ncbi:MAG: alpha/beta hydrolase [Polyangiales bacterium]
MTHDALAMLDAEHADAITWLRERGADTRPHPGGCLLDHLRRTARRLDSWGAEHALVRAGLCHAIYGTHGHPDALCTLAERRLVRARIGAAAEALVYAYGSLDRRHAPSPSGEQRDRFSGEYWLPSAHMQHALSELTAANELDVAEHAELTSEERVAVRDLLLAICRQLSPAASSALHAAPLCAGAASPAGPDSDLAWRDLGVHGPHVVLWHGGATPELTWSRQHAWAAAAELRLRIPWRRGFAPSRLSERQDWEHDTRDLLRILPERAHVVAHSYGGVSAVLAAGRAPERFASLTVIEAPLSAAAIQDPEVEQLVALSRAFAQGDPEARESFLALAGLPLDHPGTRDTEELARNFRDPSLAQPPLSQLRAAGLPVTIVSGAHNRAIERVADVLADGLGAERWVLPGAGHAVQKTADFNTRFLQRLPRAHAPSPTERRSAGK